MSDSSFFRLLFLKPGHVDTYIESEDSNTPSHSLVEKRIAGSSRSEWFVTANRGLIVDAELGGALGFLSGERPTVCRVTGGYEVGYRVTGEYRLVPPENWSLGNDSGYLREYTVVLPNEISKVAIELEKLWNYCVENIGTHEFLSDFLSYSNEQELIASLKVYADINSCPSGDEGNTSDFYFFALFAVKTVFSEAAGKDLAAIYVNEFFVPVEKAA